MQEKEIERRFGGIKVWARASERAPHKPLLLLYALGQCARGEPREIPFRQIDPELKALLQEFGPPRKAHHPEYPFWRLQNDRVWEIPGAERLEARRSNTDAKKSELLKHNARGGFPAPIYEALQKDRSLLARLARQLLETSFPESIHEDILSAVGLDLTPDAAAPVARDPKFRERVMTAYEHRCAVCGFDVHLGTSQIGLEAAHIMWHQAGGPSEVTNGLALCVLHHKLFDRGAFTISPRLQVELSEHLHGTAGFEEHLLSFHGKPMRRPQSPDYFPRDRYLAWHIREVFRGPARWPGDHP